MIFTIICLDHNYFVTHLSGRNCRVLTLKDVHPESYAHLRFHLGQREGFPHAAGAVDLGARAEHVAHVNAGLWEGRGFAKRLAFFIATACFEEKHTMILVQRLLGVK